MDTINRNEIDLEFKEIPDDMYVLINKEELDFASEDRFFQVAFREEIDDDKEDVLVYLIHYDIDNKIDKPMKMHSFNEYGIYTKNYQTIYPPIYRKKKEELVVIK